MKTSAEVDLPQLGTEIGGKYRLERPIGEGGMGVVFAATHLRLNQAVAIKVLQPARSDRRDAARFMREARAAALLQSHHVARVLDVDSLPNGLPFMVMEFLDGVDLERELGDRGRLGVSEAVDYVLQACDAVAEAHARGIVHRDLKPSNLFLVERAGERIVKVLDFGISKMVDEASVTITSTTLGTPLYMSPEQIRNSKVVDHRSDIWSLGVILFELLTGQPPFEGHGGATAVSVAIAVDPPPWLRTLRNDVPQDLEKAVMRMLEKDPEARFGTVAEVAEALQPFATDPQLPGHVRISQLPRSVSTQPTRVARRTASTAPGRHHVHSSWTTDSRRPAQPRFVYYAVGAGAFVLGGAFAAALIGPALLEQTTRGDMELAPAVPAPPLRNAALAPSPPSPGRPPAADPSAVARPEGSSRGLSSASPAPSSPRPAGKNGPAPAEAAPQAKAATTSHAKDPFRL